MQISKEQTKQIAYAVHSDIRDYISANQEKYQVFLLAYEAKKSISHNSPKSR